MSRRFCILFYILSWSWGLPLTLCGAAVIGILRLRGVPIHRFGPCLYAETGKNWGGLELGMFFLKDKSPSAHICLHEAGHAVQNIIFGPLMPLIVSIPSAVRWHMRTRAHRRGRAVHGKYGDIWFEAQATALGRRFFRTCVTSPGRYI